MIFSDFVAGVITLVVFGAYGWFVFLRINKCYNKHDGKLDSKGDCCDN